MSDIIQLLPDHIANQIAAGEVVQRPASVVKELLENSIDAGAQNIRLVLKEAGKVLIQVLDDGIGMSETDARMCFERHATSKIRAAEDLFQIRTMGFRGEAMASIAAVAQVEMRTRKRDQEMGTRIVIEGSEVTEQEPCQTAIGTAISVKNLFFNIPARRIFLKNNTVEMQHVLHEFERVALANPDIFFSLHHNDEKIYHLPKANLRQRIVHLLGGKSDKSLVPISEETDTLTIRGFVGKPEFAKKTRGEQFFFVNNRYIRSNYLHHAVMSAYEDLLQQSLYPLYVIFLELDPSKIDVNVHPTKQEIKFEDERLIYNYLRVTVRHALAQHSVTPTLDFEAETGILEQMGLQKESNVEQLKLENLSSTEKTSSSSNNYRKNEFNPIQQLQKNNLKNWETLYQEATRVEADSDSDKTQPLISDEELEKIDSSNQHLPYQLHNTYLVTPIRSGFMLIDQQAAHQRILYEQYLSNFRKNAPIVQQKLFPQTITLPTADAILLKSILLEINKLGIEIREFNTNSFVLYGTPSELQHQNEQKLIEILLEQYKQNANLELDIHETLAKTLAQQSAIPQGKALSPIETQQLIDKLFACEVPYQAPNGRKTFITIELDELEKRFL